MLRGTTCCGYFNEGSKVEMEDKHFESVWSSVIVIKSLSTQIRQPKYLINQYDNSDSSDDDYYDHVYESNLKPQPLEKDVSHILNGGSVVDAFVDGCKRPEF